MSLANSIPASELVQVNPNVLSAGGESLDIIALVLTNSARVPMGTVESFPDAESVRSYFGSGSNEDSFASIYFSGFVGRSVSPEAILFTQFNTASVAAFMRGGSGLTLAQIKAVTSGTIAITTDGTLKTSSAINLAAATSPSNAATLIQAAFTTPNFVVSWDSVIGAFVFTSSTTGAASTITFGSGTAATALLLTSATGAVLSQGAIAAVPGTFMDNIVDNLSQNWATFALTFDPDTGGANTNKLAFAQWNSNQNQMFAFVCWDSDVAPANSSSAPTSLGALIEAADISGTTLLWGPDFTKAAFTCGTAASIDFTRTNGRITFAYRRQEGLTPDVTNQLVANNLLANGYNYYGAYATRSENFNLLYNGSVSGQFAWLDSYINQIWLNSELQNSILLGMTNAKSIPYNSSGYALIEAFCMDPINAALNFGAIRAGVTLSASQIEQINLAAGADIANIVQTRGWYLQVKDASPVVRANRGSPPCTLWYADGGSVQKIVLDSIEVQ
jgi:hypothetical protein